MKVLTFVLSVLIAVLCACIVLPPPSLLILWCTMLATEFSPVLLLLSLMILGLTARFNRGLALLPAVCVCIAAYPLSRLGQVQLRANHMAPLKGGGGIGSTLGRCLRDLNSRSIEPRKLPLNMLFYAPLGHRHAAVIVDIYGGAWQQGTPESDARFDSAMALHGYAVFAIDYRHAPQFHFPAQLDDVQAALRYLRSHASDYDVDSNQLILCGRSSGAQLALLAAYRPGGVPIEAVISFYGPTDLLSGYTDKPDPDPIHVQAVLRAYLGGPPGDRPESYLDGSPIHFVRPNLPPTLLIQGARDHIVKPIFSINLYKKLEANADPAALLIIPWAEHAFDFASSGLGNQVCLPYLYDFLAKMEASAHGSVNTV